MALCVRWSLKERRGSISSGSEKIFRPPAIFGVRRRYTNMKNCGVPWSSGNESQMTLGGSSAGGEHRRLGAIFIKSGGGQAGSFDSGERVFAQSEGLMVEYLVVALQHPSGG